VVCTGKAEKRAVVVNDELVIRTMMTVIYTFDHRYGDAGLGVRFLRIIKAYIEDPENFNIDNYEEAKPFS
jgi:pyruvate/2-oxoglutarate dehydrogenase complex dihydrolipoamide acyltransferase (E2) component